MALSDNIGEELKVAMRAKDKVSLESLRAIKSAILLAQTEKGAGASLTEDEELKLLQKLQKQRKDSLEIYEQQGDGDYLLLRPSCYFFMLLELHTLDHKAPPPTPDRRIEKILEKMSLKLDKLIEVKKVQEVKTKKIPFHYLILGLLSVVAGYFFIRRKKNPLAPAVPQVPLARPLP